MWNRIRLNADEETLDNGTDDCLVRRTGRCVRISVSAIATKVAFLFLLGLVWILCRATASRGTQEPSAAIGSRWSYDIVNALAFSPDGRMLASASSDKTVVDLGYRHPPIPSRRPGERRMRFKRCIFSRMARSWLAVSTMERWCFWNTATWEPRPRLTGHCGRSGP